MKICWRKWPNCPLFKFSEHVVVWFTVNWHFGYVVGSASGGTIYYLGWAIMDTHGLKLKWLRKAVNMRWSNSSKI